MNKTSCLFGLLLIAFFILHQEPSLADIGQKQTGSVSTSIDQVEESILPSTSIWFETFYDPWRKEGGLSQQQRKDVARTSLISLIKILLIPHPGTLIGFGFENPHDIILQDREEILFETYAIENLDALPDNAETKQLTNAWMKYLTSGKELLSNYLKAYKERDAEPDLWKKVKAERKTREEHLRQMADENYRLEQEARKASGLSPKHYRRAALKRKTYDAIR